MGWGGAATRFGQVNTTLAFEEKGEIGFLPSGEAVIEQSRIMARLRVGALCFRCAFQLTDISRAR